MSLLRPALTMVLLMSVLLGLAYPLGIGAVAGIVFPRQAAGSLIERDGVVIGSASLPEEQGTLFLLPGLVVLLRFLLGRGEGLLEALLEGLEVPRETLELFLQVLNLAP